MAAPDGAKDITSFVFRSVDNPTLSADVAGEISGNTIAVPVPFGADVIQLIATFETTGANVAILGVTQTSGLTANDFTGPVVYRITAADGSTQDYTITATGCPNPAPPPPCPNEGALALDLDALQQALELASALGLVGEPGLVALEGRKTALDAELDTMRRACPVSVPAQLATDVQTLTVDLNAYVASGPLGLKSFPPSFVVVGESVSHAPVLSVAPAGFTFALVGAPSGVVIDPSSGLLTWTPGLLDKGAHQIRIKATNGTATAEQVFTLTVAVRQALATAPLTSAASTVTVSGSGTPLDGAVVKIPAGLIATTDTLTVSMIDPAPTPERDIRVPGPAIELQFASGLAQLDVPVELELPAPTVTACEQRAGIFTWSPPVRSASSGNSCAGAVGSWASAPGVASAGTVTSAGMATSGTTMGTPIVVSEGNYRLWVAPAAVPKIDQFRTALRAVHESFVGTGVGQRGLLDPSADGTVSITIKSIEPDPDGNVIFGRVHNRQTMELNRDLSGALMRNIVAHELFHVVQFHTPWKLGHGLVEYKGGARWWMEATAELVGHQFEVIASSRLVDPKDVVRQTLTSWIKGDSHQYDSFIFFDYLEKQHGFGMKAFWETVTAAELKGSGGDAAAKVLATYAGQGPGGIPYPQFVRAYNAQRTSANFSLLAVAAAAPSFAPVPIPETGSQSVTGPDYPLPHLSSYTCKVSIPPTGTQPLLMTFPGSNVEASIYVDGSAGPPIRLSPQATEQDIGAHPGETLWIDVVNSNVDPVGDGTFGLSFRLKPAWRQVDAGGAHTCGVRTDGTVGCWGYDGNGQATAPSGVFSSVSAGNAHNCGVRPDGSMACWGWNAYGQATAPGGTFSSVSAGSEITCGVRTDGTLACWGYNGVGQATPPGGTFSSVSASGDHACGVRTDGTVACWGLDANGQTTPPSGTFSSVAAGGGFTCGLRTDGTLACWGWNDSGRATPPGGLFTSISADSRNGHSCAVRTNGTVACWGYNYFGQTTAPGGLFSSVSAGNAHSCGVHPDGSVACWGWNAYGQATAPP